MKCPSCNHENIEGARFCADCGVVLLSAAGSDQDPFVGKLVGGRFRITRQLGEGGMGLVYEGEQQMGSVKRKVAVKTLHKHLSSDPSISARFHRECGTIAQLEHPNTIKVYDFGTTDDGVLYIAMEFLDGKPLDQIVAQGAMDPNRVLHIVRQTAGSLEEAHNLGVIHRDLKPENIVLVERAGEKDVVKLLDFGIAARTESADSAREQKLTQQGMVLGTPPYMSPEQFTGQALDRRSDIYSLAIVTYEMLTGRLPFEANTAWQWATQHMTMAPRSFEDVAVTDAPVAMRAAIMKALSKNPEERQATAAQFAEELAGKVTVGAAAVSGTTGTEQMAAVPKFGATAEPSGAEARGGSHAVARTVSQPVVATTTPERTEKGGRGMVFGLIAVGSILAAGLTFAAFGQKEDEPVATLELPTGAPAEPPPAAAEEVPTHGTEPATEAPTTPTVAPPTTPGTAITTRPPVKGPTTPKPGASSTPPAATPSSGDPKPPVETPKPPVSSAACDACLTAAKSGNLAAARGSYAACADAEQKSKCSGIAKRKAGSAVQAAVKSGNCAQAAAIAAAAAAMNATSAALKRDVQKCNP